MNKTQITKDKGKAVIRENSMNCRISVERNKHDSWSSNIEEYPTYSLYKGLIRFFSNNGYFVSEDKEIKKNYSCLNDSRRVGRYKDLQFKMECARYELELKFYQDKHTINPHGGYYDFDKWELAPYMERLEFRKIINKLILWLEGKGISVEYIKEYKGADRIIQDRIKSCHHPQKEWFNLFDLDGVQDQDDSYYGRNAIDKDGEKLVNGCVRYFVGRDGYLHRGKCYHDINMNWWVLEADDSTSLQACWALFSLHEPVTTARKAAVKMPEGIAKKNAALKGASNKDLIRELKRRGIRVQKAW